MAGPDLAESVRTQETDGYVPIPCEAVRMDLLQVAPGVQLHDVVGGRPASRS